MSWHGGGGQTGAVDYPPVVVNVETGSQFKPSFRFAVGHSCSVLAKAESTSCFMLLVPLFFLSVNQI